MATARIRDGTTISQYPANILETHKTAGVIQNRNVLVTLPQHRVMRDIPTPGFAKRKSAGETIVSPMIRHSCEDKFSEGQALLATETNSYREDIASVLTTQSLLGWTLYLNWKLAELPDQTICGHAEVDAVVARQEEATITGAYAKVGEPDLDTFTELAELKETLQFIASPVRSMVRLTKRFQAHLAHIERQNARYAKKYASWEKRSPKRRSPEPPPVPVYRDFKVGNYKGTDVSSSWLAYRYGLMPLMYTFQDVQKLLYSLQEKTTRMTARSTQESVVNLNASTPKRSISYGGGEFSDSFERMGACKVKTRAGVLYTPDWSLSRRMGLQLHRLPMTAYELIPLSFVSDWFHNGADVYNALTAECRAQKVLGAWVVTTISYDYSVVYECTATRNAVAEVTGNRQVFGTWQRRRIASVADVGFQLRLELNTKRIADGLALIHNFLATAGKRR